MKSEFKNLPSGWRVVKLGEICNVKQGLQIPISERFCENAQNRYFYITNEFLKEKSEVKYYIENPPESTICFCDDILMTRTGNTGMVVTNVFGVFHNNFFKIAYDRQLIKKEYFVFLLTGPKIQNEILKRAGSSTIPDLNHSDFLSIKIPLPPLVEQEKIAEILSTWDEAINLTINLIENKKQFKKALMQNLLTAKIRFPEFKDEWKFIKLSDLLDYEQPTQYLVSNENYDDSFDIPVLTAGKTFFLGYTNETKNIFLDNLPVIIFDDFTTATQFVNFPFKVKSSAIKILKQKDKLVNIKLIYEIMQMINFVADDHKRYWISEFQDIDIKLPNLNEQQKIAELLTSCDDEINLLNLKLENFKKQKQGLMQKLLSGKVRI